jgi:hypothetical protein
MRAHFGDIRVSEITAERIEEFKDARLAAEVRAATVNRDLAVLRGMLKIAERKRLITFNPFREVEMLEERKERRQPHILTYAEDVALEAEYGEKAFTPGSVSRIATRVLPRNQLSTFRHAPIQGTDSNLPSPRRISRKMCRFEVITTPGLRCTLGGKSILLVRLSAINRTANWPCRNGC